MDLRFKLLLSYFTFISTFKFQEMIGVGVCFWHSDHSNSSVFCLDRPKNTVVVIEPPGQITEGSKVTLTCRTDANPPAHDYRWYKNGRNTHLGNSETLSFSHVSYEDRGEYSCQATNTYGSTASPSTSLRVLCELKFQVSRKGHTCFFFFFLMKQLQIRTLG